MVHSRCWNCYKVITSRVCPTCGAGNSKKGFALRAKELEQAELLWEQELEKKVERINNLGREKMLRLLNN
jgi:hypothetical protein